MKGTHIAVISAPGPVHVNPTLSTVATLVRRGHRVTYVTSRRFADEVDALGAEPLLCPRIEYPFDQDSGESLPVERQYSTDRVDLARRTLKLVEPYYTHHKPALILYDTCAYAGLVLSQRLHVPAIRTSPQLAYDETNLHCEVISPEMRRIEFDLQSQAEQFYSQHGIPPTQGIFDRRAPTVYFYLRQLQLDQHLSESNCLYAARCTAERPCHTWWRSSRGDSRPTVLITSSTVYAQGSHYYRACAEAASTLGWNTILSISKAGDCPIGEPLPAGCEMVHDVPQIALLPHVDIIICLGGMATSMEAMYHGVPMIMLTHGYAEAETYAQNAANFGIGYHLKRGEDGIDDIRRSLLKISCDGRLHGTVKRVQRMVRQSPGGKEVADWLEERLENNSLLNSTDGID